MRTINLIFVLLIFIGIVKSNAQETITFKGKFGNNKDTAYYFLDNKSNKLNMVTGDSEGNYSFQLNSKKADSLTIYFKDYKECSQIINLKNVREQNKTLKTNMIINDLKVINRFACIRELHSWEDVVAKYGGTWKNSNNLSLKITGDYIREIRENGILFFEEGEADTQGSELILKSYYIKNSKTGTYQEVVKEIILKLVDGRLVSTDGIEYFKTN